MSIPIVSDIIEDVNHFLVIELFLIANKRPSCKSHSKKLLRLYKMSKVNVLI